MVRQPDDAPSCSTLATGFFDALAVSLVDDDGTPRRAAGRWRPLLVQPVKRLGDRVEQRDPARRRRWR